MPAAAAAQQPVVLPGLSQTLEPQRLISQFPQPQSVFLSLAPGTLVLYSSGDHEYALAWCLPPPSPQFLMGSTGSASMCCMPCDECIAVRAAGMHVIGPAAPQRLQSNSCLRVCVSTTTGTPQLG